MSKEKKFNYPLRTMGIPEMIWNERVKQDAHWGEQNHDELKWQAILAEECGEVANAVNELTPTKGPVKFPKEAIIANLEYELVQVAAVCVAWIEAIRRKYPTS
ncbi:MAG TPA: hypothetical protein PLP19_11880 [bacterium]|nr:hypothetical protein [bacterium]HPN44181.1 hypothetical protein [bacterium]